MDLSELITPETISMITSVVGGGSSAYVFIKLGLFVLGKVLERRKAKKVEKEEQENQQERRRLGRILSLVSTVVSAVNTNKQPDPEEPVADSKEPLELEELITAVVKQIRKEK